MAPNQTSTGLISLASALTATTSSQTTDLELMLFADWHGDVIQLSDEPTINDMTLHITGIDANYTATLAADSDGNYWARDIPVGKMIEDCKRRDAQDKGDNHKDMRQSSESRRRVCCRVHIKIRRITYCIGLKPKS